MSRSEAKYMKNKPYRTIIELDRDFARQVKTLAFDKQTTFIGIIRTALKEYLDKCDNGTNQYEPEPKYERKE
jgi:hypothetical protein